ncbi:hypothetical protein N9869_01645 [Algibacter sp.]|nr:hypothetical protein [Algibacter sp.]MDB4274006.1 hypothetical protein [Algibacter sp.]
MSRTKKEKEKGAVGVKNMSKYNPGKLISGKLNRPDDAAKSRTKKEQEQARGQRFIAPTAAKITSDFGKGFGLGAGSVDRKTGKQIVSKDRDIPTRKQEKERAMKSKMMPKKMMAGGKVKKMMGGGMTMPMKKKMMGGGMTKIKYKGGGIVQQGVRPTKYV